MKLHSSHSAMMVVSMLISSAIGAAKLEAQPTPIGLLSETEFFNAIDMSVHGLEKAKQAWKTNDIDLTRKYVADYYRNRTSVPWHFDPHHIDRNIRHDQQEADAAVNGTVTVVCVTHTYPDGNINWLYNKTLDDKSLPPNNEWLWQLNRMGFWYDMGRTYWATGDERYAQAFVKQLRNWTSQCLEPPNSGNYPNSAWRTIECGIRLLGSWPSAYHYFLHSKSFTDEDLILLLRSSLQQMRHLLKFPSAGNWLTMEMNGVYTFASFCPELKEAADARRQAIEFMNRDISRQFLPDGSQFELTPGYHNVALDNVLGIMMNAIRTNHLDEIPNSFSDIILNAFLFNLKMMTPNRDIPRYNDSWNINVVASLRKALQIYKDRDDFKWCITEGREGKRPDYTSVFMPWGGYCAMRSGWSRNDNYVGFDVGPLGRSHVHQDKLNLVIWGGERQLLFDDGGGCYETSPFRKYATSAFGHNTVIVDGLPQFRTPAENYMVSSPIDAKWQTNDIYDFASMDYRQGFGTADNCIAAHTRQVLFIKPDIVVVADFLVPNDTNPHDYQARWQVYCTKLEEPLPNHPSLITTFNDKKNLLVAPLLTDGLSSKWVSAQTEPEVLGWYVIKDGGPYQPAATVCHSRKGSGMQRFLTILMPVDAARRHPVTAIHQDSDAKATVLFDDGRSLTIDASASPETPIQWKMSSQAKQ